MSGPPRWVEPYLATPFIDRGRTFRGFDCFGLVRLVLLEEARILLNQYGFVPANAQKQASDAIQRASKQLELWKPFVLVEAQSLDVVPMFDRSGVFESHVGIMVSPTHVLHTEKTTGPVCLPLTNHDIVNRLVQPLVYRHRELQ